MSLSTSKKKQAPAVRAEKKTSFSDRQYVEQAPHEDDIAVTDEGARYLPIDVVERDLDRWGWNTVNFVWRQFRDKRGNPCVEASLELVIPWKADDGVTRERRLVGGCNFTVPDYAPNGHFVATAKSECVKNAASDLGKRFGRGLNEGLEFQQAPPAAVKEKPKRKPDKSILEDIKKAIASGDDGAIAVFESIYEFNKEDYGYKATGSPGQDDADPRTRY